MIQYHLLHAHGIGILFLNIKHFFFLILDLSTLANVVTSLVAMKQDPCDRSPCDLSLVNVNGESHNRLLSKDSNVISKAFDTMVKVKIKFLLKV